MIKQLIGLIKVVILLIILLFVLKVLHMFILLDVGGQIELIQDIIGMYITFISDLIDHCFNS